jgi:fatty-acid desaturase
VDGLRAGIWAASRAADLGEAFHDNHHAAPWSAAFALRWREFDPGFRFIWLPQVLGLPRSVKCRPHLAIARREALTGTAS